MKDQITRILIASSLTLIVALTMYVAIFWVGFEAIAAQVTRQESVSVFYQVLGWLSDGYLTHYYIAIPLTFCIWLELINYLTGRNDQQEQ